MAAAPPLYSNAGLSVQGLVQTAPMNVCSSPQLNVVRTEKGFVRVDPVDMMLYRYKVARNLSATLQKRRERNMEWHEKHAQSLPAPIIAEELNEEEGEQGSPKAAPRSAPGSPTRESLASIGAGGREQTTALLETMAARNGGTLIRGQGFAGSPPLRSSTTSQGLMFEKYNARGEQPDVPQVHAVFMRSLDCRTPTKMLAAINKLQVNQKSREAVSGHVSPVRSPAGSRRRQGAGSEGAAGGAGSGAGSPKTLPNGIPVGRWRHDGTSPLRQHPHHTTLTTASPPLTPPTDGQGSITLKGALPAPRRSDPPRVSLQGGTDLYARHLMQGGEEEEDSEMLTAAERTRRLLGSKTLSKKRTPVDEDTKALISRLNANLDAILDNFGVRTGAS